MKEKFYQAINQRFQSISQVLEDQFSAGILPKPYKICEIGGMASEIRIVTAVTGDAIRY